MESLTKARMALLYKEPYYGRLLINMKTIINRNIDTAGVGVSDKVELHVNPNFFNGLEPIQQIELLKHECAHVINGHMLRKELEKIPNGEFQTFNVCADVAINEPLPSLHEMGWNQDKFEEFLDIGKINRHDTMEYYYRLVKANEDKLKQEGKIQEMQSLDDHSLWDNTDENIPEEIRKEALKKTLEKTANECGAGQVPHEAIKTLEELRKSTVDWKKKLREFVARSAMFDRISTRKKRNRRYGTMFAGKKKKFQLNLAIAMDVSGSVSDEEILQFFSEVDKMYDQGVNLTIIEADTQIAKVYPYTKKTPPQRNACGGTAYQPAFDKAAELGVDGVIYFGDMDCFDKPKKPNYPVLWAIVGNSEPPAKWGSRVKVEMGEQK